MNYVNMVTLRIVGDYYLVKFYDPILVIMSMLTLLISQIIISKLFFWLAFNDSQSDKKFEEGEPISDIPDILMQKKGNHTFLDYSIKASNYHSLGNASKIIAVLISILLVFTFLGDLLSPL